MIDDQKHLEAQHRGASIDVLNVHGALRFIHPQDFADSSHNQIGAHGCPAGENTRFATFRIRQRCNERFAILRFVEALCPPMDNDMAEGIQGLKPGTIGGINLDFDVLPIAVDYAQRMNLKAHCICFHVGSPQSM